MPSLSQLQILQTESGYTIPASGELREILDRRALEAAMGGATRRCVHSNLRHRQRLFRKAFGYVPTGAELDSWSTLRDNFVSNPQGPGVWSGWHPQGGAASSAPSASSGQLALGGDAHEGDDLAVSLIPAPALARAQPEPLKGLAGCGPRAPD